MRIKLFRIENKVQIAMEEREARGISQKNVYAWHVRHFCVNVILRNKPSPNELSFIFE